MLTQKMSQHFLLDFFGDNYSSELSFFTDIRLVR